MLLWLFTRGKKFTCLSQDITQSALHPRQFSTAKLNTGHRPLSFHTKSDFSKKNGRQKVNATLRISEGTMELVHEHSAEVIRKGHLHCCHLSCLQNNGLTVIYNMCQCDWLCHGWKETQVNSVPSAQHRLTAMAKDSAGRWAANRITVAPYCTKCHSMGSF